MTMKTSEIINRACTEMNVPKSALAKQMGMYPSSLYRKLARESMTLEELQACLGALGVTLELELRYPDGSGLSPQENHALLMERMGILERRLETAARTEAFLKRSLIDLRTELNSAVGCAELGCRNGAQAKEYQEKLRTVLANMKETIACVLCEPMDGTAEPVDAERLAALAGKRVLIADDNELNRDVLRELLVERGLLVEEADNGCAAVEAVQAAEPGAFLCVLMDIEMPELDGFGATTEIRKLPNRIRANTPILALTANAIAENRRLAIHLGMDGFLTKPIDTNHLLACMVKLL